VDNNVERLEEEVLANLITFPEMISKALSKLPIEAFENEINKKIYICCIELYKIKKPITIGIVCNNLKGAIEENINWEKYIRKMTIHATNIEVLEGLIETLTEKYRRNKIKRILNETIEKINKKEMTSDYVATYINNQLLRLLSETKSVDFNHIRNVIDEVNVIAKNRFENKGIDPNTYTTGFHDLNSIIHGFKPGQLIVVAGRTGMGKTTLGLNFIKHFAQEYKDKNIIIISREVLARDLTLKLLSSKINFSINYIQDGKWLGTSNADDKNKNILILSAMQELANTNIYYDDSYNSDVTKLEGSLNTFLRDNKEDIGLILVDYLQILEDNTNRGRTRENEVAKISRTLKKMALDFKCPIIALSQLGRRAEQRKDNVPLLSDLRESGAIEQDADIVILIYTEEREIENIETHDIMKASVTELHVAKNRNGPLGKISLLFDKVHSNFSSFKESGW